MASGLQAPDGSERVTLTDGNGNSVSSATADTNSGQNLVLESIGLFNGTTFDRVRSIITDTQGATGIMATGNMIYDPVNATYNRLRQAPGAMGVLGVNTEGTKATYSQSAALIITGAGDNLIIQGSTTKTIRILRVSVSGTLTTGAMCNALIVRRSTAATGGTLGTADAVCKHDINSAAPTATVTVYTVAPTQGTSAGVLRRENVFLSSTSTQGDHLSWDFSTRNDQAAVLRGTSDWFAINLGSQAAGAGSVISLGIEWTEE